MGNTEDGSLDDWPLSVQKIIDKYPAINKVVPGHGKSGGTELLTHTKELLKKTFFDLENQAHF